MKQVQVLMTTYNGEKYLREQIDSILGQTCEAGNPFRVSLLVRDDGSKDGTQEILREYAEKYPQAVRWYAGRNVGVKESVFTLLRDAPQAAYYALADQDDYWERDKISCAVRLLGERGDLRRPCLYCCRPQTADENLQPLASQIKRPPMRPSFGNALIENIVTGCTAVFNEALRSLVAAETPQFTMMHDHWLYLAAACFGTVIYDETPHILYRQHAGNVVGLDVDRFAEWRMRLSKFWDRRCFISRQAAEFVRIFGKPSQRADLACYRKDKAAQASLCLAKELLAAKKSVRRRQKLIKSGKLYRQRRTDGKIFDFLLFCGMY